MSINRLLKKLVLRFEDQKLEDEYLKISLNQQKLLMLVLIVAQLLIFLYDSFMSFHFYEIYHIIFRFGVCFLMLIALVLYKPFPFAFEALFVVSSLLIAYYMVLIQVWPINLATYDNFKKGLLVGILQVGMMLSMKRYWLKIVVQGIFLVIFVVHLKFYSQFCIQIFFLAYWALIEGLQRSLFRDVKLSEESFKKFQILVSKDLPTAIIILDSTLKNVKFTNEKFDELLNSKENMEKIDVQNDINSSPLVKRIKTLKDYINANRSTLFSSSFPDLRTTGFLNLPDLPRNHFDIKIRKISWDKSESFAILLDPITEKLNLIAVQKVSEYKDEVIAAVSHELRTPINGIIGMISILMSKNKNDEMIQYLKNCLSCANLLKSFVNSILDINQIKATKLKLNFSFVNLAELIEELRSIFEFQISAKELSFLTSIDPALPKLIRTDKNRLLQILINLTTNAIKFTTKGSVTISLANDPENRQNILFKVIDTGVGIKEENLQKLFKKFGKLENEDQKLNEHGVGLGLLISNELVKIFNNNSTLSRIQVASTLGKGTIFSFSIPIDPYQNDSREIVDCSAEEDSWVALSFDIKDEQVSRPLHRHYSQNNLISKNLGSEVFKKKALIVDDLPFNLVISEFLFKKVGLDCKTALSGDIAINLLEKYEFDLIFLDINMPNKNGFEVAQEINLMMDNGIVKKAPIIALSAGDPIEHEELKKFGICSYLMKPLNEENLMRVLEEMVE